MQCESLRNQFIIHFIYKYVSYFTKSYQVQLLRALADKFKVKWFASMLKKFSFAMIYNILSHSH